MNFQTSIHFIGMATTIPEKRLIQASISIGSSTMVLAKLNGW